MSRNHAEQQIRKLAAELYEKALAEGAGFDLAELIERLVTDLSARFADEGSGVIADLIEISARQAIADVDKERTKPSEQPSLLADLDGVVAVGDSKRRARRSMNNEDWARHIGYLHENAARVNARLSKEDRRYAALLPYLSQGMDTEAALRAWMADNPDQELS